jgi:hypothetical protein
MSDAATDKQLTHEDVERWVGQRPREIIERMPDCPERDAARTHINQAERLAHKALEKRRSA